MRAALHCQLHHQGGADCAAPHDCEDGLRVQADEATAADEGGDALVNWIDAGFEYVRMPYGGGAEAASPEDETVGLQRVLEVRVRRVHAHTHVWA
jgi:hypothetical protein